jgi:hypothetical protein|tara:strand:+ start:541 stop:750 length:210 start_codon:yes stop_codon:yes gene_type:complete
MKNNLDEYLTTKELADHLKISEATLESWRAKSTPSKFIGIPYVKFGRTIRYKKNDILEYERRNAYGIAD